MEMKFQPKMRVKVWLVPADPQESLEEAVSRAQELGYEVLEVDKELRQILVIDTKDSNG